MQEIVNLANLYGTKVIFIELPGHYDIEDSLSDRLIHKYLHKNKNELYIQLLKKTPFNVLYASEIFRKIGKSPSRFYLQDELHLSADGSKILAKEIHQEILRIRE